MNVKIFSFFSGLGFLDLGFENAGFKIDFVDEFNENFLKAYKYARRKSTEIPKYGYSHKSVADYLQDTIWNETFTDLKSNTNELIGFIGGPPCPDFSIAGKNEGEKGKNGQLTGIYFDLIKKRLPDFFVFENVKGLYQTKKHREFYNRMKESLTKDYALFDALENALEYGVPQFRERLILVGFRKDVFGTPKDFSVGMNKKYLLSEIKSKAWPDMNVFVPDGTLQKPDNIIEELTVEYWFRKNDVLNHLNSADVFGVQNLNRFELIPEGDVARKSFKRLHRWRYSPTAAYGNNEVHLHPYKVRRISVAEALAIQSLPKGFEIIPELTLSEKFKMVGNGVPYLLAFSVAKTIKEYIMKNGMK